MENRLTYKDAAKQLGVSTPTISRWVESGKLTSHQNGQTRYLTQDDIDTYLYKVSKLERMKQDYDVPYIGDIMNIIPPDLDEESRHKEALKLVQEQLKRVKLQVKNRVQLRYVEMLELALKDRVLPSLNTLDFEEIVAQQLIDLNTHLTHSFNRFDEETIKPVRTTEPDYKFWKTLFEQTDAIGDGEYEVSTYEQLKAENIGSTDMETMYNMLKDIRRQTYIASLREPQDSRSANLATYAYGLTDELLNLTWVQFKTLLFSKLQEIHYVIAK